MQDLLDPKILRQKLELAIAEKNVWLQRVFGPSRSTVEDVVATHLEIRRAARPPTSRTPRCSSTGRSRAREDVLFEGAQGTLLDLDHGTYPLVTSSSPIAGRSGGQLRHGPGRIDE